MKTVLTLMLVLSVLVTPCNGVESRLTKSIRSPAFSVDSNNLFFEYCENYSCDLIMFSIGDKTLTKLLPSDKSLRFTSPGMGQKSSQIVAMATPRDREKPATPQIVLIDLQERTFRRLTNDSSQKYGANFSFDGGKLAYVQSHRERTWFDGSPRPTGWEVHTIDMVTGVNTKQTDFCFYSVSKPFFLPTSDDLVFSAAGPMCNYPDFGKPRIKNGYLKFEERFSEDTIIRFGASRPSLEPWFRNDGNSANPSVAQNSDVLFTSRTNKIDGITKGYYNYDLFLRKDGTNRRLTRLKTIIEGSVLSPDSKSVAYISDPERNRQPSLWLLDIDKESYEMIPLSVGEVNVKSFILNE